MGRPSTANLCQAIREGDLPLVRVLLAEGADVNGNTRDGITPLETALDVGGASVVTVLLEAGADPNHYSKKGLTPLHLVVDASSMKQVILDRLLAHGAKPNCRAKDNRGETPLLIAARSNRIVYMRKLLDAGASPNMLSGGKTAAIHVATYHRKLEMTKLLLERGADVNILGHNNENALNNALNSWSSTEPLDLVKLLLDHGANPNIHRHNEGNALAAAWGSESVELIELMLRHGASPDTAFEEKTSALFEVIENKDDDEGLKFLDMLLDAGASVGVTNADGETPLQVATAQGKVAYVRALLHHGADANGADSKGGTPLFYLRESLNDEDAEIAYLLLHHGADPNAQDRHGRTLLHHLIKADNKHASNLAHVLLDKGANSAVKDAAGKTPKALLDDLLRPGRDPEAHLVYLQRHMTRAMSERVDARLETLGAAPVVVAPRRARRGLSV